MRKSTWLLVSAAVAAATAAFAGENAPRFEDFPAQADFKGRPAAPKLTTRAARRFRTLLKSEAVPPPNFGGHFKVIELGCGAGCAYPAIVDLETGNVFIPGFHTVLPIEWKNEYPIRYRLESRLLAVAGDLDETGKEVGTHYFEWTGKELKLLKFVPSQ